MTIRRPVVLFTLVGIATLLGVVYWSLANRAAESPFKGRASAAVPELRDRTIAFGLTTGHRQGDERLTGLDEALGAGACAFDYDNDGWMDIFLVNGAGDTRYYGRPHWWQNTGGHRLFHNVGGERFVDVTKAAGIAVIANGMGCVAADLDADGDTDLLVTNAGSNALLRNNGDGTFTDVTGGSGLEDDGWHTAAAIADVDGDGLLDVYIGKFIDFAKSMRTFEPQSQYRQDTSPLFNSALFPALPNRLYRNRGGLQFEDATDGEVANGDGRTLAALWLDINGDRKPDLIVANATGTGSTTGFTNLGDWHFQRLGLRSRIDSGLSFRSITPGDFDNDGREELLLTGSGGSQSALLFRTDQTSTAGASFTDEARKWHIAKEQYAAFSPWGAAAADFDNDGWTDVFVANGQLTPDPDAPHVTVGQPKQIWMNRGDSSLLEYQPPPMSPLLDHQSARGVVVADFNNDGKPDLYVAHNNDLGELLINATPSTNHWIGVRLLDSKSITTSVGARVSATTVDGTQVKWLTKGTGFLSDGDPRLLFGLGAHDRATLHITWSDGADSVFRNVAADTYVDVSREGGLHASPPAPRTREPPNRLARQDVETRIVFVDALASVDDDAPLAQLLRATVHDPDERVRAALIRVLDTKRSAMHLELLLEAFDDPSEANAAAAVDAACAYEEEFATRFLIRMFDHPAAIVREHTALCFLRYYEGFQAQQAVIHRKYLAVPYLVALTADSNRDVKIAVARALAAAERFRGVQLLAEMAGDLDTAVQQEAIRALGRIRDKAALPALERITANPGLAPGTYAQLFIALKRLDDPNLDTLLDEFARGRGAFAAIAADVRMASLLAITQSNDGIVFARPSIVALAGVVRATPQAPASIQAGYAEIVAASGVASAADTLTPLRASHDPAVRLAAYRADFMLRPAHRAQIAALALRDPAVEVRRGLLRQIASDEVTVPDAALLEVLNDPATRPDALPALRGRLSERTTSQLVSWVLDARQSKEIRIAALSAMSRTRSVATLPAGWDADADDDLRIAAFKFECTRLPSLFVSPQAPAFIARTANSQSIAVREAVTDFLLARDELWATREVADRLANRDDPELRRHTLEALPLGYALDTSVLLRIATDPEDPLRLDALRRLRVDREPALSAVRTIAANDAEDEVTRMLASAALPGAEASEVVTRLLSQ